MKDNFNCMVSVNPTIEIGDINGNVGLCSLSLVLVFFLVIVVMIYKKL